MSRQRQTCAGAPAFAGALWPSDQSGKLRKRGGRVCAGNPGRVSCTNRITRLQNFHESSEAVSSLSKNSFRQAGARHGLCSGAEGLPAPNPATGPKNFQESPKPVSRLTKRLFRQAGAPRLLPGRLLVSGILLRAAVERRGKFPRFPQKNFDGFGCIAVGNMVRCFVWKDKWP